jgi:hypothetical protein
MTLFSSQGPVDYWPVRQQRVQDRHTFISQSLVGRTLTEVRFPPGTWWGMMTMASEN